MEPGQTIDQYRLIRPIGDGGMGEVWLAQQELPIRREVALKLVRRERMSERSCRRFIQERQTLAMLNHPNICGILDAGTTEDGTPYFVMQWLDGLPITKYCDLHQLDIAQRLELFGGVCDAFQFAHDQGILHRDIKPANVLVCDIAGKPIVQVIDFGLSKITGIDDGFNPNLDLTYDGEVIGTLRYMSPEHASRGSEGITVQSEVYSLGVLLFELLVGRTPKSPEHSDSVGDFLNQLRTNDSTRPSQLLSSDQELLAKVLEDRKANAEALKQVLKLDLDWVVLKALHRLPKHRYGSVREMGEEIRLYLAGKPVSCRTSELGYRIRKVIQRHGGIACVVAASVLITLAAVGTGALLCVPSSTASTPSATILNLDIGDLVTDFARSDVKEIESFIGATQMAKSGKVNDCSLESCQLNRDILRKRANPNAAAIFAKAAFEKAKGQYGVSDFRTLENGRIWANIQSDQGLHIAAKSKLEQMRGLIENSSPLGIQLELDLAKVEEKSGRWQQALDRLQRVSQWIKPYAATIEQIKVAQQMARLYWKLQETQLAVQTAEQTLGLAQQTVTAESEIYVGTLIDLHIYRYAEETTEANYQSLLALFGKDRHEKTHLALLDLSRLEALTELIRPENDGQFTLCFVQALHSCRLSSQPEPKRLRLAAELFLTRKRQTAETEPHCDAYLEFCNRSLASQEEALVWIHGIEKLHELPDWKDHSRRFKTSLIDQKSKFVSDFSKDSPAAIGLELQILLCDCEPEDLDLGTVESLYQSVAAASGASHPTAKRLKQIADMNRSLATTD